MPAHGPYLPAVSKSAGYRTMFLSSSYLESWGETRVLQEAGLDVLEDGKSLPNRGRYKYQTWSIEGRADRRPILRVAGRGGRQRRPLLRTLVERGDPP